MASVWTEWATTPRAGLGSMTWRAPGRSRPPCRGRDSGVIAVDGKTLRGCGAAGEGGDHVLAALDHVHGAVLGQVQVGAKTNEIPMFPVLLDRAAITGAVITADAMHAQRSHATYLAGRGAHYVLAVKRNQPGLFAQLAALPWRQVPVAHQTRERGHGRAERRTLKVTAVAAGLAFPHAAQAIQITRRRTLPGQKTWTSGLPPGEGDVGDAAGAVHGLDLEAVFERLQPIPEPFPAAQHDGHHDDVQVVDQAGGQELADSGRAAADADISASGGLARLRKRLGRAGVQEDKRGTAVHLDGGPGMVGEHKNRGMERRVISPPSVPLLVRPGAVVGAELPPAHDPGADARSPGAGKSVIDAGAAAGLALHGVERAGREQPLVQPDSRVPERGIQALPFAGAEPIQRHREIVHPHLRHTDLPTRCFTATGTGWRARHLFRQAERWGNPDDCG